MSIRNVLACAAGVALMAGCTDRPSPVESTGGAQGLAIQSVNATQDPFLAVIPQPNFTTEEEAQFTMLRERVYSKNSYLAQLTPSPESRMIAGERLSIEVAPGHMIDVLGKSVDRLTPGRVSWVGYSVKDSGFVVLVLSPDGVSGTLRSSRHLYRIEALGKGVHVISEIDESKLPEEHSTDDLARTSTPQVTSSREFDKTDVAPSSLSATFPVTLDVMVVYTASAIAVAPNIISDIAASISAANTSYTNSQIYLSLKTVYIGQVSYNEYGDSFEDHLDLLRGGTDGVMDNVHALRDAYYADVVILVVNNASLCGRAYKIHATNPADAFAAVHVGCVGIGALTLAHEIGHLQGARHDFFVDNSTSPFQYGHGAVFPPGSWRTVMAYANTCPTCDRIPYWSNPNVVYPGTSQVMGSPSYEDNARVLQGTRQAMVNFRSSLTASISGPTLMGHNTTCTWTASASGGTPPYSHGWSSYIGSPSTYFYFSNGSSGASVPAYGLYYGGYPITTNITVFMGTTDSDGQYVSRQQNVALSNSYTGSCWY